MDLDAIAVGLRERLATIGELQVNESPLDAIDPPTALVAEFAVDYDKAFGRGLDQLEAKVRLYVTRADVGEGTSGLNRYLAGAGALSVKAAIEGDRTLGGAAETLQVIRAAGYGVYDVGSVAYIGAEFTVAIWAKGAS